MCCERDHRKGELKAKSAVENLKVLYKHLFLGIGSAKSRETEQNF